MNAKKANRGSPWINPTSGQMPLPAVTREMVRRAF
jgi:hypothetical protein